MYHGVSIHHQINGLFNSLLRFTMRHKKNLHYWPFVGIPPVTGGFFAQRASNVESVSISYIIMIGGLCFRKWRSDHENDDIIAIWKFSDILFSWPILAQLKLSLRHGEVIRSTYIWEGSLIKHNSRTNMIGTRPRGEITDNITTCSRLCKGRG